MKRLLLACRRLVSTGEPEEVFRSSLDDQAPLGVGIDQDRYAPPLEIERDLVDLPPAVHIEWPSRENSLIERALHAGLKPAVDVSESVCALALHAIPIDHPHEPDRGFGQRAGLIRAQH